MKTATPNPISEKSHGPLYYAGERFIENKAAVIAGGALLLIILTAIFAPLVAKTGYNDQVYLQQILGLPRDRPGGHHGYDC